MLQQKKSNGCGLHIGGDPLTRPLSWERQLATAKNDKLHMCPRIKTWQGEDMSATLCPQVWVWVCH